VVWKEPRQGSTYMTDNGQTLSCPTYLLFDGFSQTRIHQRQNSNKQSYLQYLALNVQSNFSSLSGHLFKTTLLPLKRIHPCGQRHITNLDLQMLRRDYLGQVIMSFGTIQGILGNHQIWCMGNQGPKDFLQDKQSLESNYDPHLYLLRG
jgi:hypothetical protein